MDGKEKEVKQKILDTISSYEERCQLLQDDNTKLRNNLSQLTSIASGLSTETDDAVSQIHALLNQDQQIALPNEVDGLISTLVRAGRSARKNVPVDKTMYRRLLEGFKSLPLPQRDSKAIDTLLADITESADKQLFVDQFNQVFHDLVVFLQKRLDTASTKKAGFLGKITSNFSNNALSTELTNALEELLRHLTIPREYEEEANAITRRLSESNLDESGLLEVLDSIVALIVETTTHEHEEFKGFLENITKQLDTVESFVMEAQSSDIMSGENSQKMQKGVTQGLKEIGQAIESPHDIKALAAIIGENLQLMASSLISFQSSEEERLEQSKTQRELLTKRLQDTEKEVEQLRLSLSFQRHRARHDSLTGIPNREAYNEHIVEAVQRWQRGYGDLSLVVCDIDFFKKINDSYGHLAGDKVLTKLALMLKTSLRSVDFVARYGGEEFVIIMEKTMDYEAGQVMEKLRELVATCPFHFREQPVTITMSFGVTAYRPGENTDEVFSRADDALYQAKHGGRNQVVIL